MQGPSKPLTFEDGLAIEAKNQEKRIAQTKQNSALWRPTFRTSLSLLFHRRLIFIGVAVAAVASSLAVQSRKPSQQFYDCRQAQAVLSSCSLRFSFEDDGEFACFSS